MENTLNIAVSKGRVFSDCLPLLSAAGLAPVKMDEDSRKLVMDSALPGVKIVIVRGSDVPTYVTHGVTELGIVGKDMLMEYDGNALYELLDFGTGRCRLMLARHKDMKPPARRARVATKHVNSTRDYFLRKGVQVEIIKLYGALELSPLVGLSDYIVDLVDTGKTLDENGLEGIEEIADISTRLIANKAVMKTKREEINKVIDLLREVL